MICLICNYEEDDLKKFSNHLKKEHKLSSKEYTVKHIYKDKSIGCVECGEETRYVSFSFKEYCKDHSKLAMKKGGSKGGQAEAWNKNKTKETDERLKTYSEKVSGNNNPFWGKTHTESSKQKISTSKMLLSSNIEDRIKERDHELKLITSLEEYRSRQKQYLEFQCIKCNTIQKKTLQAFERGSRCYKCYPVSKSKWELEVLDYVKSRCSDAESGNRSLISPKEIDIWVPSKKLGIECHGLYWHNEDHVDKRHSLNKQNDMEKQGYKLLQLFYDEWRDKSEICKSLIDNRLGVATNRLFARKCCIKTLTTQEQKEFFQQSHLSGYTPAKISQGLFYEGKLVSAISLRKPRHGNKYKGYVEIARYATLPGYLIVGGLSKLISKINFPIMTYVDRRVGQGNGYVKCGFKKIGETGPDYWYTDNILRYDRFKYRAQNGMSEKEVTKDAGVVPIWGCGSHIMLKEI